MTSREMARATSPEGRLYVFHPDHRNNHPDKSQWTVPKATEFAVFERAEREEWGDGESDYWGLHLVGGEMRYLGRCTTGVALNIAHFVGDDRRAWHGYPANPMRSKRDRPSDQVLDLWETSELIRKHQRKKLVRGQLCSL